METIKKVNVEAALRESARDELASVREALERGVEKGGEARILLYATWAWGALGALANTAESLGLSRLAKVLHWHMSKL